MDKRVATSLFVGATALLCFTVASRRDDARGIPERSHRTREAAPQRAPSRREEIAAHQRTRDPRYRARLEDGIAVAENEAKGLSLHVDRERAVIRTGAAEARFHLAGIGRDEGVGIAAASSPIVHENDVRLARGDVLEWYANGPLGIEQGFEISRAPTGTGALRVELDVGGLSPTLESDHVALRDEAGIERLRYSDLFAYDAEGDDLVARLDVVGARIVLTVEDTGATYPVVIDPLVATLSSRLDPSDTALGGRYGSAVAAAVSGTDVCAVFGAPYDDRAGVDAGTAYIARRTGTSFTQVARITGSDTVAGDGFGLAVDAMSISGGCRYNVGAPSRAGGGKVYVFEHVFATGAITQIATVSSLTPATGDEFGAALASFSASFMLFGAPGEGTGAVYFQRTSGATFLPLVKLATTGLAAGDRFGAAIAMASNTAYVGAPSDDAVGAANAGSMLSFAYNGTTYVQEAKIVADTPAADALFGSAVADVSATRVIVGEPGRTSNTGAAYVVSHVDGVLALEGSVTPTSLPATGDQFGASVTAASNHVLVGTPFDDTGFSLNHGSVYHFTAGAGFTYTQVERAGCAQSFAGDNCGEGLAIAITGTTVLGLYGEPFDDTDSTSAGAVTVRDLGDATYESVLLPDGTASNAYGTATAIDGDTAAIGAPYDDDVAMNAGAVYVFQRAAGTWALQAKLVVPNSVGQNVGGSLALSGNTLVVGSANGVSNRGYVFTRTGTTWSAPTLIIHPTIAAGDQFGYDVAIDGGTIAFGAPGVNGGGSDRGAVMVYTGAGSTWTHQQTLTASGAASLDYFGRAVDVAGDLLVAGAPGRDPVVGVNVDVGAALVFARTGTTWTEQASLAGVAGNGAAFGAAVDIQGTRIVVGAPFRLVPAAAVGNGMIRTFVKSGVVWNTESTFTMASPVLGDELGASVALTDQLLLAGAPGRDDATNDDVGVVLPYMLVGGAWVAQASYQAPGADASDSDAFGQSVAISGQTSLVGAPGTDVVANDGGAVYAHTLTKQNGDLCGTSAECGSGFCVDGRCCASACSGGASDCQACSQEAGGTTNGTCTPLTAATAPTITCRAANGTCDVAEVCVAGNAMCPANAFVVNGTSCGGAPSGLCDAQDTCQAGTCTANYVAAGTTCRGTNGNACDVPEVCSGSSAACPNDLFVANGTACGGAPSGVCDAQDTCQSGSCSSNYVAAGTTCRGTNGNACDVAEVCSGSSAACPSDGFAPSGTACGGAPSGPCDVQDTCSAGACVAKVADAGEICRNASGACDLAETCNGSSTACPADVYVADGTVCDGELLGPCDAPDSCSAGACTPGFAKAGTSCRASADKQCDVAEVCDGASVSCPNDAFVANGTACGESPNGECDAQDSCSAGACVALVQPSGAACRAANGECDVAEVCDGTSTTCPSDVLAPDGKECGGAPSGDCDEQDVCKEGTCSDQLVQGGVICRESTGACDAEELCTGNTPTCPSDAMGCCTMDADCSDGNACTVDTCTDGLCVADETIAGCCTSDADCDDGDDCTKDVCDANVCGHEPALCMADGGMGDAGMDDAGMQDASVATDAAVPDDASVADDASVIPPDDAGVTEDAGSDASDAGDAGGDASTEEHGGGGCGCATKGTAPSHAHFVWLALLAILALRRRR